MNKPSFRKSTVGRKVLAAVTGMILMAFIVVHLAGNLTLFIPDDGALFNSYAHHLEKMGPLLYAAEFALIVAFLIHIVMAVSVRKSQLDARPERYAVYASKGGPSKQTLSSRSMLVTGILLLLFIPLHVWMFKFNQAQAMPMVDVNGEQVKDLYLVVLTAFKMPQKAVAYVAVMLMLGLHLRHGFWSSFQSLGALAPKWVPAFYSAGLVIAILLAGGFIVMPLYLWQFGPDPETLRAAVATIGL
ncbi:MAG: succinate dehydrogenase cytochrome b subunit [Kiritimatiellae bacterium]|nr:succinate dehydrogenase cytochrome b subunit [Kiritimatiellia bacterium]